MPTTDTTKLSFNLPNGLVKLLRRMAAKRQVTMTDVVRSSVETANLIESAKGRSRFLIEDSRGNRSYIIFR